MYFLSPHSVTALMSEHRCLFPRLTWSGRISEAVSRLFASDELTEKVGQGLGSNDSKRRLRAGRTMILQSITDVKKGAIPFSAF